MNDDALRALVRESIARQTGARPVGERRGHSGPPTTDARLHASHGIYMIPRDDEAGSCVIEPSVPCTHCNYCKSHGH